MALMASRACTQQQTAQGGVASAQRLTARTKSSHTRRRHSNTHASCGCCCHQPTAHTPRNCRHLGVLSVDELEGLCQCLDSTRLAHGAHHLQGHGTAARLAGVTAAPQGAVAGDKGTHQGDAGRRLTQHNTTHNTAQEARQCRGQGASTAPRSCQAWFSRCHVAVNNPMGPPPDHRPRPCQTSHRHCCCWQPTQHHLLQHPNVGAKQILARAAVPTNPPLQAEARCWRLPAGPVRQQQAAASAGPGCCC